VGRKGAKGGWPSLEKKRRVLEGWRGVGCCEALMIAHGKRKDESRMAPFGSWNEEEGGRRQGSLAVLSKKLAREEAKTRKLEVRGSLGERRGKKEKERATI